jgi:hypothetical protein
VGVGQEETEFDSEVAIGGENERENVGGDCVGTDMVNELNVIDECQEVEWGTRDHELLAGGGVDYKERWERETEERGCMVKGNKKKNVYPLTNGPI